MRRFRAQAAVVAASVLLGAGGIAVTTGCDQIVGSENREAAASKLTLSADALRLVDVDGPPFDLRQASKGRVHVAVFVRSDCPISNRSAPEVRELCSTYQSKGVDIYLVYVDPREPVEAIRNHLREYEYTCPALRDMKHELAKSTEATVTPEAVVWGRDWKIVYRGRINNQFEDFGKSREKATTHDLRDAIDATLAGRPVAEPVTKAIGCYIDDLK
jgi:hypothetical protein